MSYLLKGIIIVFCFFLSGCGIFNQQFFLKEAFAFDLLEFSKDYSKEEKNGLLVIEGVEINSQLYKKSFPESPEKSKGYFPVYYLAKEVGIFSWGEAYFLIWENFEGNSQMSIYYPKKKLLLLGYFSGSGG